MAFHYHELMPQMHRVYPLSARHLLGKNPPSSANMPPVFTPSSWVCTTNMTPLARLVSAVLLCPLALGASLCLAQEAIGSRPAAATTPQQTSVPVVATAHHTSSAMTAEVLYLALVGEMQTQSGEAGAGYSLLLEAARKSGDALLYRRAVEIAMQSGSGDAAIAAAKTWASADQTNTEPLRVTLQIMLGMNQVAASEETLSQLLDKVADEERNALIDLVGHNYARAKDKSAALQVVTATMRLWQRNSPSASSAWAALARVQLAAGLTAEGVRSLENALLATPTTPAAGLLAVEQLAATALPLDEAKLLGFLATFPDQHLVRMAYARHLLSANRWNDSEPQLQQLTVRQPTMAEAWLMLGALQLQNGQQDAAHASLTQFLTQATHLDADRQKKGLAQAYLLLAQVEEQRKNNSQARAWLDRIDPEENTLGIQLRRAMLMGREGKLSEAQTLIQNAPGDQPADLRAKTLAQVQLLKDAKQPSAAFDLLGQALQAAPDDADLAYEQAMLAEKLGRFSDMERLFRRVIELRPDDGQAYNALGYAMADRNDRLPEAKTLIVKALTLVPDDPFITDSLGWVEFRLGNLAEAERLLRKALATRTDIEIVTHLAEVLWAKGEHTNALELFRKATALQPDNGALKDTLTRLGIRL